MRIKSSRTHAEKHSRAGVPAAEQSKQAINRLCIQRSHTSGWRVVQAGPRNAYESWWPSSEANATCSTRERIAMTGEVCERSTANSASGPRRSDLRSLAHIVASLASIPFPTQIFFFMSVTSREISCRQTSNREQQTTDVGN